MDQREIPCGGQQRKKHDDLDNLADKLGANITAKGKVTIFTERVACDSCLGVVEQFQKKYPGVKVEVIDNNNILLIPRRLK